MGLAYSNKCYVKPPRSTAASRFQARVLLKWYSERFESRKKLSRIRVIRPTNKVAEQLQARHPTRVREEIVLCVLAVSDAALATYVSVPLAADTQHTAPYRSTHLQEHVKASGSARRSRRDVSQRTAGRRASLPALTARRVRVIDAPSYN